MKKVISILILGFLLAQPMVAGAKGYYFHEDHLGGSAVVTDEDGEVAAVYDYYPFGEVYQEIIYDEEYSNSYKYTGQEEDSETGLYYYGSRYYDAGVGRFMSQDPAIYDERLLKMLKNPQALNSYAYVLNNPVKYTDPSGEEAYEATSYFTSIMNYSVRDVAWMKDLSFKEKLLSLGTYVATGQSGDIKNTTFSGVDYSMDSVIIGGNEYTADVLGNIMFGYIGSSIGLSGLVLTAGAGLYEFFQGLTNKNVDIEWEYFASFFDDPADRDAIKIGIQLYEEYGDNLTEEQIIEVLSNSGLELGESRADNVCYEKDEE